MLNPVLAASAYSSPAAQPRDSVNAALSVALGIAETFSTGGNPGARFLSETKVKYIVAFDIRRVNLHGPKVGIRMSKELRTVVTTR